MFVEALFCQIRSQNLIVNILDNDVTTQMMLSSQHVNCVLEVKYSPA